MTNEKLTKVKCKCGYTWNTRYAYKGFKRMYATCPMCKKNVTIGRF